MGTLDNKVAIVTGGGGGIGGAIVQRFAREGAKLAVADINRTQPKRASKKSPTAAATRSPSSLT